MTPLNILIAYPYVTGGHIRALKENEERIRFVLDSGAFTAWKAGSSISLDDYCKFIENCPVQLWRYFTLDVIGDPEGTRRNYETMRARGFTPVPIFTRGEELSAIDEYYETSDLIGIGGLVGTQGNKGFVNGIMKKIAGRKAHLLGFCSLPFLKAYRPFMCDSSSWSAGVRYVTITIYAGRGKFVRMRKAEFRKKPPEAKLELIRRHGVDPRLLGQAFHWVNTGRGCGEGATAHRTISFRAWAMFQRDIEEALGIHMFLACSGDEDVRSFLLAHDWLNDKRVMT